MNSFHLWYFTYIVLFRIAAFDDHLLSAIDELDSKAGACVATTDAALDVVLTKYEAQLAAAIQASLDVNQEGLDSLKEQIVTLATSLDTLLNDGLTVAIGCVIPGSKNVKACLDENTVKFNDAIAGLLADALLLLNEALSTVGDILTPVSI